MIGLSDVTQLPNMFSVLGLIRNRRNRVHSASGVNQSNLNVTYQHESVIPSTLIVKLALLNIRYLLNKSFLINEFICTYQRFFFN